MVRKKDLTALFDLDGTLCDHDKALKKSYELIKSPLDKELIIFEENLPEYIENRINLIRSQPGWWEKLEKLEKGFEIYSLLEKMGFKNRILTKGPTISENAWTEKLRWVKKNIQEFQDISIVKDKSIVYGRILVDDYPPYLSAWLKNRPRGVGIMPAQEYNKGFRHPRVFRYDGTNLEKIKEVALWARERNGPMPRFK